MSSYRRKQQMGDAATSIIWDDEDKQASGPNQSIRCFIGSCVQVTTILKIVTFCTTFQCNKQLLLYLLLSKTICVQLILKQIGLPFEVILFFFSGGITRTRHLFISGNSNGKQVFQVSQTVLKYPVRLVDLRFNFAPNMTWNLVIHFTTYLWSCQTCVNSCLELWSRSKVS